MSKTSTQTPLTDKDRRKQISIRGLPVLENFYMLLRFTIVFELIQVENMFHEQS